MAKIHTLLFNMFLANVRAYSFVLLLLLLLAVVFVVFHPVLFFAVASVAFMHLSMYREALVGLFCFLFVA